MESQIDLLTADDIFSAQSLVELAGWNQQPDDWLRLIDREPQGCFKVSAQGNLLGTVTTISYGSELAWIGMMLVHPDARRQGIGKQLMRQAIDFLKSREVQTIGLDATPAGRPLYEQLGFRVSAEWQRWKRESVSSANSVPRSTNVELIAVNGFDARHREFDASAFGVDRWSWLELLAQTSLAAETELSFGLLRSGRTADYLGPVVAVNPSHAGPLIQHLLTGSHGPCLWDVPPQNPQAESLAKSFGFQPVRTLYRMWLEHPSPTGKSSQVFAISDPATG